MPTTQWMAKTMEQFWINLSWSQSLHLMSLAQKAKDQLTIIYESLSQRIKEVKKSHKSLKMTSTTICHKFFFYFSHSTALFRTVHCLLNRRTKQQKYLKKKSKIKKCERRRSSEVSLSLSLLFYFFLFRSLLLFVPHSFYSLLSSWVSFYLFICRFWFCFVAFVAFSVRISFYK